MKVYSLKTIRETKFGCYWQLVYSSPMITTRGAEWITSDRLEPEVVYGYIENMDGFCYVRLRHEGV